MRKFKQFLKVKIRISAHASFGVKSMVLDLPVHAMPTRWNSQKKWCNKLKESFALTVKGGFDAVLYNESPLLGLSNSRSALQALQLREYLQRAGSKLRWVASDLGDSLAKKRADCQVGLQKFLKKIWLWAVKYDPQFIASKKNKKEGKTAMNQIDDYLKGGKPDLSFYSGATDPHPCQVCLFDMLHKSWHSTAICGSGGAPFFS